jgi:hypothetical protein
VSAAFIGLLILGVLALLAGLTLTRLHWRPDIPPYGRRTRFLDVTPHPEAYVKDAQLRVIRTLNRMGRFFFSELQGSSCTRFCARWRGHRQAQRRSAQGS